jgi:protein-arginine kinase activator protein McsA
MHDEIIAQEVLNLLMESGAYRSEEIAVEVLENAPEEWMKNLKEEASYIAIINLQESLKEALENRDFDLAREIKEKLKGIIQSE